MSLTDREKVQLKALIDAEQPLPRTFSQLTTALG